MLKVKYKKSNNVIEKVEFIGHALYDEKGKDIVCASASSIFITTVNGILNIDKDSIDIDTKNNIITNLKKDIITNKLLENMINLLKELESNYQKNIKVMEE